MEKTPVHVIPAMKGGWVVRRGGSTRAARRFNTREEAEDYARQVAEKQMGDLVIHKNDGTVLRKHSYQSGERATPPGG